MSGPAAVPSELDDLRARVAEAEDTLRAIQSGEVDALLITDASGERVYTLRGADAPYRALVEQMQEGAVTLNAGGDIVYCNQCFATFVNVPLQQVIGASIAQFVDPADHVMVETLIAEGEGRCRTRLVSASRSPLDAQLAISSVTVDDVERRTVVVTDLSTLTRLQQESRSKDEFLAMLAHELRNPLGAMSGAVQVLGLSFLQDPRAVRAHDVLRRQVSHMARLVEDLLDVGRVVTGKITLDRRPMDLGDVVRAYVMTMSSGQDVARNVETSVEPVWVDADRVRLEQVIGNLLSNAFKFTTPDRPIRVSVTRRGAVAVLRVVDEGAGISPEVLPDIFELFVQDSVGPERAQGGLGIGLTLVRRLVALHGGSVEAESRGKGHGSTFTVLLPATRAGSGVSAEPPMTSRRVPRRVLVVEDHQDAREMYATALRADGHEVYEARDGGEAFTVFCQVRPDVAVVDIGLPGMDGYELARRVRAAPSGRDVTLIALTGYGSPDDRERSQLAGFDRHFVKPVAPGDLRQALSASDRASEEL